ncbi:MULTISPECIES: single-stranded-DNA-specific exonuclease RecJ [unclassified Enterococcus]|uniref:single-stranded-DNA-specific exonuclease RecJ n=1 Tax=unclassified Enterococcus TaxID=2608891 RepID=UPI0015558790|nr:MULTISPECIES: single-stranded-DNA-specific exonuclease RecJ [unclassified Enterococcus]MBS7576169.1 single-stranded-DNA-specific exonuclease RecJ [Enterococcus sp. MMGLQ5-2]MBS7583402.1 single-stranded-DNA-specific exonuclease RecJ [Enterococcus sp. MMGLQ5-1]NPD11262.1 single-stranded-DNA-specific exonuclease RecJ [Enterococcus sp. MMGLQ5-1]NPD36005.1 single-stranded-DNA-specific exonuclease RecJ [Enterococcus sp. MMGLQ5-2]
MLSKFQWQLAPEISIKSEQALYSQAAIDPIVARLLASRGINSEEKLTAFLNPNFSALHDPFLLNDMQKAVERINQAINAGENILIYGDYDADGMTSTSVLKEALDELGAEVITYLPNRFTDGYGPNKEIYQYYIDNEKVSLIVTVDNGVAGHEAIEYAQNNGVDVIVTDHHGLPQTLPNAYAIIHPEYPDSSYPFKYLAGVGVAFKLSTALLGYPPVESLDLVAIGTIADMVSLTDENRVLVSLGLAQLRVTEREGLIALFKLAGVHLSTITEETIGFQIAPRLNALGRLDDPNPAVSLLTSFEDDVVEIAEMIEAKNTERRAIVEQIREEASELLDLTQSVQILAKANWHPGVLGIVAGNIVEQTGKPTILLTIENGIAKGSARSVDSLDLFAALDAHRELFIAFGGHAGAAGMTLDVANLEKLQTVLNDYVEQNQLDLTQKKSLLIDEIIKVSEVDLKLIENLNQLAPFGMDNPKPIFEFEAVKTSFAKAIGVNEAHLKLKISDGQAELPVIAFNYGTKKDLLEQASQFNIVGTLSINEWNGQSFPQLMMQDFSIETVQVLDLRSKHKSLPDQADYLVFNSKLKAKISDKTLVSIDETARSGSLVVVDTPEEPLALTDFINKNNYQLIYFKNMILQPKYINGVGTRAQFERLFKVINQYPEFDLRHKLKALAQYLKIEQELLVDMVKVFQELGFVIISEGIMRPVHSPEKKEISSSLVYQKRCQAVQIEKFFALEDVQIIYKKIVDGLED